MLFPARKEKILVLNNSNSSVLGEVLESVAESVLSKAEEGLAADRKSQGMFQGLSALIPYLWGRVSCLERLGPMSWAIVSWGEETVVAVAAVELMAGMGPVLVPMKHQGLGWSLIFLL